MELVAYNVAVAVAVLKPKVAEVLSTLWRYWHLESLTYFEDTADYSIAVASDNNYAAC